MARMPIIAILVSLIGALCGVSATAAEIDTRAREAILLDAETGMVLMAENPDQRMPTASMSKIMTVYMVFEALKEGRLSLEDTLTVSEKAWRMGGSKMFVEVGNQVPVEDLLRGIVVQSGNDACVVVAEALAGTEEAFAQRMNEKAKELGLENSNFANATGWPNPNHWSTARDLAILAQRMIEEFPDYYKYFRETEYTWHDIRQGNRNPLLYRNIGADGLKTGHTEEAGYGLTASAVQDGRRLILVVNGLDSVQARADESTRLLQWGFREFENRKLFGSGEVVEVAPVWQGKAENVTLVPSRDVTVTVPRGSRDKIDVNVTYQSPIEAPVEAGAEIARLNIAAENIPPASIPLYAGAGVERAGPLGRIFDSAKYLVFGAP